MAITPTVRLNPTRKRAVKSLHKLFLNIGNSDGKLYVRNKPFLPIFPTDDVDLNAAILKVMQRLELILTPPE